MNSSDWPEISVGTLGKGALDRWPDLESQRGVFDWTIIDTWVNTAGSHGVDLFFSSNLVPP